MPGISIVVATYNRPAWLSCAIRSVLRQTFEDWELIVVGDACTDDTAEVVAGFGDPRIRFVNLTRNFGEQAGPNNVGMAESKAPLIALLNHDDVWLPHHLTVCREVLLGEGADFVFSASAAINAQSTDISYEGLSIGISGTGTANSWSPAGVESSATPASSWLMRRAVPERLGGWRLGRECYTDPSQHFLFRAWRAGFRIRPTREVSIVRVTSGRRNDSYLTSGAAEQEWVLEHMDDPGFACELAALAWESNEHFVARTTTAKDLTASALGAAVAALGFSPRALAFRFGKGFHSPGDYIRSLRATRGLPAISPPVGDAPAVRFDMVRRSCRIDPPAEFDFAAGAGGARYLASGWSRPEGAGVWSDGPAASLLFDLGSKPESDVELALEAAPYTPPGRSAQTVDVSTGERDLATWTLREGENPPPLRIPSAELRHPQVLITFRFPTAASPISAGISGDPRLLAMRLIRGRLTLEAA